MLTPGKIGKRKREVEAIGHLPTERGRQPYPQRGTVSRYPIRISPLISSLIRPILIQFTLSKITGGEASFWYALQCTSAPTTTITEILSEESSCRLSCLKNKSTTGTDARTYRWLVVEDSCSNELSAPSIPPSPALRRTRALPRKPGEVNYPPSCRYVGTQVAWLFGRLVVRLLGRLVGCSAILLFGYLVRQLFVWSFGWLVGWLVS